MGIDAVVIIEGKSSAGLVYDVENLFEALAKGEIESIRDILWYVFDAFDDIIDVGYVSDHTATWKVKFTPDEDTYVRMEIEGLSGEEIKEMLERHGVLCSEVGDDYVLI